MENRGFNLSAGGVRPAAASLKGDAHTTPKTVYKDLLAKINDHDPL
jgi:hypothetical protein